MLIQAQEVKRKHNLPPFTRADLTAVCLLAPLSMPAQYGLDWPATLPEPLQSDVEALADQLQWAKAVYGRHR